MPALLLLVAAAVSGQSCLDYTTRDVEGPFFEPDAPKSYELAPEEELADPEEFVLLQGQVVGRDCRGVPGALVEVWYAGGSPPGYTFPPGSSACGSSGFDCPPSSSLWYRGRVQAGTDGRYQFLATMPKIYSGRPILHYHYKVTTDKAEFITQAYFRGEVPPSYEDYVRGRQSQFAKVESIGEGRRVTMNIRLEF